MKSRLAVCCTFLLLTAQAGNAQVVRQFSFRLAASSNNQTFSSPRGPSLSPAKRLHTIDAGIYAELFPSSHVSILLGVEYQVRGGGDGVQLDNIGILDESQRRIGYISFPMLLKYRSERSTISPYIISYPNPNDIL